MPFTPTDHGNQVPFISQSKRRKNGWPQFFAAVAQVVMYGSHLPAMIDAREKPGSFTLNGSESDPQLKNGIAPARRTLSIATVSKA